MLLLKILLLLLKVLLLLLLLKILLLLILMLELMVLRLEIGGGSVVKVVDLALEDHLALDLLHLLLEVCDARGGRGRVGPVLVKGWRVEGTGWQLVSDREREERVF